MNPFIIGSALIEPYYFAYSTANAHYGLTTQLPSTYYIATTKKRPSYEWRNIRFQFITLSDEKFFGFKQAEKLGAKVNIADPEKTLIDAIDKMQYCGGVEEVVSVIQRGLKQADASKLIQYLNRMNSYTLNQRFGFIVDYLSRHKLAIPPPRLRSHLLQNLGKAPIYLDSARPKHGTYVKEWNIMQNVADKELLSETR
jgi:predicted transcriptional regulator of viral defense system